MAHLGDAASHFGCPGWVFWGLVVMDGPAQTDKLRMANAALREIPSIAGALHNSPGALLAEVRRLYQQLARLPRFDQAEPNTARRPTAAYLALEAQIRGLAERYREGPGESSANYPSVRYRESSRWRQPDVRS